MHLLSNRRFDSKGVEQIFHVLHRRLSKINYGPQVYNISTPLYPTAVSAPLHLCTFGALGVLGAIKAGASHFLDAPCCTPSVMSPSFSFFNIHVVNVINLWGANKRRSKKEACAPLHRRCIRCKDNELLPPLR